MHHNLKAQDKEIKFAEMSTVMESKVVDTKVYKTRSSW